MVDVTFPILQGGGVRSTSYHDVCINYLFRVSFWRLWLENEKAKERERESKKRRRKKKITCRWSLLLYTYTLIDNRLSRVQWTKKEKEREIERIWMERKEKKKTTGISLISSGHQIPSLSSCVSICSILQLHPPPPSLYSPSYTRESLCYRHKDT